MRAAPQFEEPEGTARGLGPRAAAALALAFSVAHFASFETFTLPLKTDIRYFLYFAWRVAEGETPHLELFDPKTQLATFAGALLYRIGDGLGFEPLDAIRVGYLSIAALGAWLVFFVHRRITGSALAGGFGVLAVASFALLGELPAQGNVPKLLMTVCAAAAALCAGRGRWFAAGVASSLAFMDWQIGAVVGVSVLLTAAWTRAGARALALTLAGGAAGLLPFLLFFAWRGALGVALDQTIASAFFRGSVSAEGWSAVERLRLVANATLGSAQGQAWLVVLALAGLPVAALRLRRGLRRRALEQGDAGPVRVLLCATLTYLGVLAFSLIDFQARGDSLVVLHAAAFFLALLLFRAFEELRRFGRERPGGKLATALPIVYGLLSLAAARPGPLREPYEASWHRTTLAQQREVARELEQALEGRVLAAVERCEMLFLLGRVNPLPFVYWNAASWGHYRDSERESAPQALRRLLEASGADAWIVTNPIPSKRGELFGFDDPGPGWRAIRIGDVLLHVRDAGAGGG